ncbi:MAG: hypothetical protein VYA34_06385 [Myxococcota bacterium]|nr:hypothetical protein [Myxococcota bacterium]
MESMLYWLSWLGLELGSSLEQQTLDMPMVTRIFNHVILIPKGLSR